MDGDERGESKGVSKKVKETGKEKPMKGKKNAGD